MKNFTYLGLSKSGFEEPGPGTYGILGNSDVRAPNAVLMRYAFAKSSNLKNHLKQWITLSTIKTNRSYITGSRCDDGPIGVLKHYPQVPGGSTGGRWWRRQSPWERYFRLSVVAWTHGKLFFILRTETGCINHICRIRWFTWAEASVLEGLCFALINIWCETVSPSSLDLFAFQSIFLHMNVTKPPNSCFPHSYHITDE